MGVASWVIYITSEGISKLESARIAKVSAGDTDNIAQITRM